MQIIGPRPTYLLNAHSVRQTLQFGEGRGAHVSGGRAAHERVYIGRLRDARVSVPPRQCLLVVVLAVLLLNLGPFFRASPSLLGASAGAAGRPAAALRTRPRFIKGELRQARIGCQERGGDMKQPLDMRGRANKL